MKSQNLFDKQSHPIRVMQFWGGVPQSPNSKWQQTLRIIKKCSERGWKSIVVFSEAPQSNELIDPFLHAGADILIHQRLPNSLNLHAIMATYRFLRRHPCDIIHCYARSIAPLLAATFHRVPVRIWSKLGMSSYYAKGTTPTGIHKLQLNLRLSCLLSDKIFCIAQSVENELTSLSPSIEKKTVIGGAGIDLELYSSGSPANIRNEFSLSKNNLIIASVGHAVPVKGWDILLQAYSKFQKIVPQSKLLLIGSTETDQENETLKLIMQLIKALSLEKNVVLTGKRHDIPNILAASDIYVQPSRSEGLGLALIEALAAGLPCVASNVGGIKDIIRNGKNGLLFEREDVNELAESMLRLANDSVLQEKLSKNTLQSVQHYGLETVTDAIINVYLQSLEAKKGNIDDLGR